MDSSANRSVKIENEFHLTFVRFGHWQLLTDFR
jgi:hypothetical protein